MASVTALASRTRMGHRSVAALGVSLLVFSALAHADGSVPDRFDTVIIDAGHGGEDQGARGPQALLEKELVLDVARRLAARLEAKELRVVMTRADDRFVPLEERTSIANDARGDLFISIHANAADSRRARGVETYFLSLDASDEQASQVALRENKAFRGADRARAGVADPLVGILEDLIATEHLRESNEFARLAHAELAALDGSPSRGVKQAPFVVLMGVQMPASLVEVGFLSNSTDAAALRGKRHRERIAEALARAVEKYWARYDAQRGMRGHRTSASGGG